MTSAEPCSANTYLIYAGNIQELNASKKEESAEREREREGGIITSTDPQMKSRKNKFNHFRLLPTAALTRM